MPTPAVLTDGLKLLGSLLGDDSLALDDAGMCSLSRHFGGRENVLDWFNRLRG